MKLFINTNSYLPNMSKGYTLEFVRTDSDDSQNVNKSTDSVKYNVASNKSASVLLKSSKMHTTVKRAHTKVAHKAQPTPPHSSITNQGQKTTNLHLLTAIAKIHPMIDSAEDIGNGDSRNSVTNGTGNESMPFDWRMIQYGQEVAYAIKQNIVVPDKYRYTKITYRAFIVLDKNMQFQNMVVIKSTGYKDYDDSLANALSQTIYPPLPAHASWEQFHNINFHID